MVPGRMEACWRSVVSCHDTPELPWASIPAVQKLVPRRWRGSGIAETFLRKTYRPADSLPRDLRHRLRDAYPTDVLATAELLGRDSSRRLD